MTLPTWWCHPEGTKIASPGPCKTSSLGAPSRLGKSSGSARPLRTSEASSRPCLRTKKPRRQQQQQQHQKQQQTTTATTATKSTTAKKNSREQQQDQRHNTILAIKNQKQGKKKMTQWNSDCTENTWGRVGGGGGGGVEMEEEVYAGRGCNAE